MIIFLFVHYSFSRRFDLYTRSCTVLASLFAIGLVLIIIIVLSLIPIYISQKASKTATNIQTTSRQFFFVEFYFFLFDNLEILITNYNLRLESSVDTFDPQTVLSDANNRLALQAALTSMLQQDSMTVGSVVEIDSTTSRSQMSGSFNLTFNLNVTWNKTCSIVTCSHQYHSHVINLLSNSNKTTTFVHYQSSNSTQIDWVIYLLPETIDSSKFLR